jgi:hypothetical protein
MWLCVYQNMNVPGPEAYWCIVVYRGEESKPLASEQYYIERSASFTPAGLGPRALNSYGRNLFLPS